MAVFFIQQIHFSFSQGLRPRDLEGFRENLVYNHLSITGYKVKAGSLTSEKEFEEPIEEIFKKFPLLRFFY